MTKAFQTREAWTTVGIVFIGMLFFPLMLFLLPVAVIRLVCVMAIYPPDTPDEADTAQTPTWARTDIAAFVLAIAMIAIIAWQVSR